MIIFQREIRRNLKLLVLWAVVIGGLLLLILEMFPEVATQQKAIEEILKGMPPALIRAFGMDQLNMTDPLGYYATKGYVMNTLFGSIFAVMLGGNILAREHSEKTMEFLLSRPVTRSRVISEKLAAVVVLIFLFNLIIAVVNCIGFWLVNAAFNYKAFAFLSIGPFLLHLIFALLAFLLSCLMKKGRSVVSVSLGLVFIMYFLEIIGSINDQYAFLKNITPFVYVNAAGIIRRQGLAPRDTWIMAAEILSFLALSYFIYRKKDIT